jgi:hypothetical protein
MAIDIAYKASVDIGDGAKSLKSLKQEFKETQKELDGLTIGSQKYVDTLRKLGDVKDQIADLNEEIAAFDGGGKIKALGNVVQGVASGFQGAVGAAALFGGESEDLQKTLVKLQAVMAFKEGLQGIEGLGQSFKAFGQALKTNPLFLVVTILAAIGTAMFALKDKVSFIGDAFDFLGDILKSVVNAFKEVSDWIGITNFKSNELAKNTITNAQKVGKATEERYDLEIAKANAAGKNTLELEKQKQQAVINTLRIEAEAIVAAAKARGKFTEEENKRFTELIALTKKATNEITIIDIKANKQREDEQIKATENHKKNLEKIKSDTEKHELDLQKFRDAQSKYEEEEEKNRKKRDLELFNIEKQQAEEANAEALKMLNDYNRNILAGAELKALQNQNDLQAQLDFLEAQKQNELDNTELTENEILLIKEKYRIKNEELNNKFEQIQLKTSLENAQQLNQGLQSLSDLFFSIKMENLKKGSKEEEAAAKKQFEINKALQLSTAIINGVQSILAITSVPDFTLGVATAIRIGAQVALNAANIAKIASTKFNSTSQSTSVAGVSAPSSVSAPSINAPSTSTTLLNPDGTIRATNGDNNDIRVSVVESDITRRQRRVNVIETASSL